MTTTKPAITARLIAAWNSMSKTARIYSIALPVSAIIINFTFLTSWMPDTLKQDIQTTCFWIWTSALAFIVPWLHMNLAPQPPAVPPANPTPQQVSISHPPTASDIEMERRFRDQQQAARQNPNSQPPPNL